MGQEQAQSQPMFILVPSTTTSIYNSPKRHQSSNESSVRLPLAIASSSQPSILSQLHAEEDSRFYVALVEAIETILSAASSMTTHRPVNIQNLQRQQQQLLTLQEQVSVARQQQQHTLNHHRASVLSELGLHQQIQKELDREAVAKALTSRLASGMVQGGTGSITMIDNRQDFRSFNGIRPFPRDVPLTSSMEYSALQRHSSVSSIQYNASHKQQQRRSADLGLGMVAEGQRCMDDASSLLLMSQLPSAAAPYLPPSSTSFSHHASQGQGLSRSFFTGSNLTWKPDSITVAVSLASSLGLASPSTASPVSGFLSTHRCNSNLT
jgi:hypothetical protein